MASNVMTKQAGAPRENSVRIKPKQKSEKLKGKSFNLFKLLDKYTNVDAMFEEGVPLKYLPYILYLTLITLFYIGNTHFAEKTIRRIDKTKVETEDLRADYTTLKSDYMEASKQSEVARNVAPLGIEESSSPPYQIIIPADEY
jgi:hypothetical protein